MKKYFPLLFITIFSNSYADFNTRYFPILNQMAQQRVTQEIQTQIVKAENKHLILLYSQNNPPVFLGCLNCAFQSGYSTSNPQSDYGNKNAKFSIYNPQGMYGSDNSNFSPCNPQALYPPIIENGLGVKYGLLTLNTTLRDATTDPTILNALKTHVCAR